MEETYKVIFVHEDIFTFENTLNIYARDGWRLVGLIAGKPNGWAILEQQPMVEIAEYKRRLEITPETLARWHEEYEARQQKGASDGERVL